MTKSLAAIFAHPDDESVACGATLARYATEGVRTSVVLATKGEIGEIAEPSMASPQNLGDVREEEARRACEILGVGALHFLGYRDGEVERADGEEVVAKLLGLLAQERPDVVITFGPEGVYGHPDHVRIGELATEAFHRYRAQRADARLFHAAMPREIIRDGVAAFREQGLDDPGFDVERFGTSVREITTKVDTTGFGPRKMDALMAHATQMTGSIFSKAPREMMEAFFSTEFFVRVWPEGARPGDFEEGLFG